MTYLQQNIGDVLWLSLGGGRRTIYAPYLDEWGRPPEMNMRQMREREGWYKARKKR